MAGGKRVMCIDKTLYISDLDGTLLNNLAELSEYTTNGDGGDMANSIIYYMKEVIL